MILGVPLALLPGRWGSRIGRGRMAVAMRLILLPRWMVVMGRQREDGGGSATHSSTRLWSMVWEEEKGSKRVALYPLARVGLGRVRETDWHWFLSLACSLPPPSNLPFQQEDEQQQLPDFLPRD